MTLNQALDQAIATCKDVVNHEERGGIILKRGESYLFIGLLNKNRGTPLAQVLWTAEHTEFTQKVYPLLFDKNPWEMYASFHTHPQFPAIPSSIDTGELFTGFPINYIYSTTENELNKFVWADKMVVLDSTNEHLPHE